MPPAFPRLLTLLCVLVLFVMVSPRTGRGRASATRAFRMLSADDSWGHFYARTPAVVNRNITGTPPPAERSEYDGGPQRQDPAARST